MTRLFNANTRSAYQAGYYTGYFTIADILTHGDTGLGALDGNDGELLINSGTAWRTAADGTTHRLAPETTSPFAPRSSTGTPTSRSPSISRWARAASRASWPVGFR